MNTYRYIRSSASMLAAMGMLLFSGCNKFLDKAPDDRTQLDTVETIQELLVSGYPSRTPMFMYELRTDNAVDKGMIMSITTWHKELFTYQETINHTTQDGPEGYWNELYSCIAVANQALVDLDRLTNLSGSDLEKAQEARGEALIIRAYNAFMLAQTYARPYDPATAATFLGIPYPTEPEDVVLKEYNRGTLAETYEQIVKDFEEGYKLVSDNYKQPKYHFTKNAVAALGTRLYRVMGNWDKVLEYGSQVFQEGNYTAKLKDYKKFGPYTYSEKRLNWSYPTEDNNIMLTVAMSNYCRYQSGSRYGITEAVTNVGLMKAKGNSFLGSDIVSGHWLFGNNGWWNLAKHHEWFRVTNKTSNTGYVYTTEVSFSTEEVLFNMAEAYIMKDNFSKAEELMEAFISRGFLTYTPTNLGFKVTGDKLASFYGSDTSIFKPFYTLTDQQTYYLKGLTALRRYAFMQTGMRWLDIRQYNLEVEHTVLSENDTKRSLVKLESGDPRYAFQLPSNVLGYGLEPNPGYEKSTPIEEL